MKILRRFKISIYILVVAITIVGVTAGVLAITTSDELWNQRGSENNTNASSEKKHNNDEYFCSPLIIEDVYEYPICPIRTPEIWEKLETQAEKLAVIQIPEDILSAISTAGLIETCLNYPLLSNFYVFNTPQEGFDRVVSRFNGLKELMGREDAGKELLNLYKAINLENHLIQDSYPILRFQLIEMMISQNVILDKLTESEKQELSFLCFEKAIDIVNNFENSYSLHSTIFLVIRCLMTIDNEFASIVNKYEELIKFAETGSMRISPDNVEAMNKIIEYLMKKYTRG
jgi:hypothetical protein